jgi:hypothetical protein
VLSRIERHEAQLREGFESLIVLDYRRSFDECVEIVKEALFASWRGRRPNETTLSKTVSSTVATRIGTAPNQLAASDLQTVVG